MPATRFPPVYLHYRWYVIGPTTTRYPLNTVTGRYWSKAMWITSTFAQAQTSLHGMCAATVGKSLFTTHYTTWHCWNRNRVHSIRQHPCKIGCCPKHSTACVDCWKYAWNAVAAKNIFRSCGYWKTLAWRKLSKRSNKPWVWAQWVLTQSSI